MFDQSSFLIAIGCAAGALAMTTLVVWFGSRSYSYLLCWGAGLCLCIPSVIILGEFMHPYSAAMNYLSFVFLLSGVVFITASATQFRTGRVNFYLAVGAWLAALALTGLPFALGFSGVGVMVLNLLCGVLFAAAGTEFWRARRELPLVITGITAAYVVLSVSFLLCIIPLLQNGQWVLHDRQSNWAEDINSIIIIFSMAIIGALMLVMAQNRAMQQHRRDAMNDPLTGLLNRRAVFDLFKREGSGAGNAAVMFDLDHFKRINDRFGHATGDAVLVRFAAILHSQIRSTDLAARLGGEEFCVLMHAVSAEGAHELAERIRIALASSEPLAPDFGAPTVSAGIGIYHDIPISFDELLREADEALYRAKEAGRNRVQGPLPRLAA